jgi:endoglucanase
MLIRRNILVAAEIVLLGLVAESAYLGLLVLIIPHKVYAAASHPLYYSTANGPYQVTGNMVVGADGKQYIFHGITRDGLEYSCNGIGPMTQSYLAFMGPEQSSPVGTYWGANTVRLPLSEGLWLFGASAINCSPSQYQAVIKQTVDILTALKLNVMLDLHWSDAGRQAGLGGATTAMPDADSIIFWQQVASEYQNYTNVLFELFNEPHPATWDCWRSGCSITDDAVYSNDCNCIRPFSYQAVGMQNLVDAVRGTGAQNIVIVAGITWGYDLSQLPVYALTDQNIVYDTHPYPYEQKLPQDWDKSFGDLTSTYPIISAESGEYDCGTDYTSQMLNYFDAHQMGWIAWAWTVIGNNFICSYPQLITDYEGTPSQQTGAYIHQHLQSYLAWTEAA